MSLILIMGIPASGKSTFCRRLENSAPNLIQSTSMDEFMLENAQESARSTRKSFERHVEMRLSESDRDSAPSILIVEDIFYLKSMRRPFERMARRRGLQFGIVYLKVELEEAMRRNARRERREKEHTIQKVAEQIEEPDILNGNVIVLESPDEVESLEELMRRLGIKMQRAPDAPRVTESVRAPPSTRQTLDVLTRRLVSEIKMENAHLDGKKLSEARKIVLARCQDVQTVQIVQMEALKEQILSSYHDL